MKFKKKDLILKEQGEEKSPEQAFNDCSKQASQNPSHTSSAPLSSFNSDGSDNGPTVSVDNDNPKSQQVVKAMASNPALKNANTTVEIHDSVEKNGNIVESVTFSKGELSSWLRTL